MPPRRSPCSHGRAWWQPPTARWAPLGKHSKAGKTIVAMRKVQLIRATLAAAMVALALAGCVGIPSSGGVNSAPIAVEDKFAFTPIVNGPQTDASREEIV